MTIPTFEKDTVEKLDYTVDWTTWLGTDTITGVPVWTVPTPLVLESQANSALKATAWISGGVTGKVYDVACKITTTAGRIAERSILIKCVTRR